MASSEAIEESSIGVKEGLSENTILLAKDILKKFPGVIAVKNVTFELRRGEIHGLLGQNGAGKSTLLKILYGLHKPDSGEIYLNGRRIVFHTPRDARRHGIALVHQEITLMPHLTALENVSLLGYRWEAWMGKFNKKVLRKELEDIMDRYRLRIDLDAKVKDLSVAEKMIVQILAALSIKANIFLFDEPTSPLSPSEVEKLFETMRILKEHGITQVFVTHKINESIEICDRITVLRNGNKIATVESSKTTPHELIKLVIGAPPDKVYRVRDFSDIDAILERNKKIPPLVEVRGLSTRPRTPTEVTLRNVNMKIYPGEIVSIYGLIGAGKSELGKTLIGLTNVVKGEIYYNGKKVRIKSPVDAFSKYKITYLPEDRRAEGLIPLFTVLNNMDLTIMSELARARLVVNKQKEIELANNIVKSINIVTPSLFVKVTKLSGGNQQKVLVARALLSNVKLVIFDEPTIGIDIGAKAEIRRIIYRLAREKNTATLVLTSDVDEALGISDRIYLMSGGTIVDEFINKGIDRDKILKRLVEFKST